MAEGVEEGDSHMEELVDHGLGMEETVHSPQRRPSLKESYHSDSLLAPDTDFMTGTEWSLFKRQCNRGKCIFLVVKQLHFFFLNGQFIEMFIL